LETWTAGSLTAVILETDSLAFPLDAKHDRLKHSELSSLQTAGFGTRGAWLSAELQAPTYKAVTHNP